MTRPETDQRRLRGNHPERRLPNRRFWILWPKRDGGNSTVTVEGSGEENREESHDYDNCCKVVDAAYTAAVDRLTEQRARLEDLRKRASALLAVAAALATFATSIGLFSADSSKGLTLPSWCMWALMGNLLLLAICVWRVLQPTPVNWMHGAPAVEMLDCCTQGHGTLNIKAAAIRGMNTAAKDQNGRHLDFCGWWYRAGAFFLLVELLLIVSGVLYEQEHKPAPVQEPTQTAAVPAAQPERAIWP
ncbi:hypothetical protein [Streptomyces sp. NPDC050534]|uniref:hypothetical protein n=1 Tax=Streptomyces sp. NPDC050534 TaxID=3365625 RepID=UPI00379B8196